MSHIINGLSCLFAGQRRSPRTAQSRIEPILQTLEGRLMLTTISITPRTSIVTAKTTPRTVLVSPITATTALTITK